MTTHRVIFDTDPGNGIQGSDIDDGLALGLLLKDPSVILEAVTVVAGNTALPDGVRVAASLLDLAGANVPLHAGAARPLQEDPAPWRAVLDGRAQQDPAPTLWRGVSVPHSNRTVEAESAAVAIARIVRENPGEITIVAVGPLTNIALAVRLEPELSTLTRRLIVMGGSFDIPDIVQELNIGYDPEAADIVFDANFDLTVVPLDATLQTFLRLTDVERLEASPDPLVRHLGATCRPWVTWLSNHFGRDGCALHDPLAAALVTSPHLVDGPNRPVAVETSGRFTRARTIAWDPTPGLWINEGVTLPASRRPAQVAKTVDNDAFIALLLDRFGV